MSMPLLFFIIVIEGFVTISAEILTIRQLLPVVGNSVIVTSIIIGVFLLFLAYGYRRGGEYQDNYKEILKTNFTKSAICLGLGLSYVFIFAFFDFFHAHLSREVLVILLLYLLCVTAPLIYILGQTVPITMNFMKAETAGAIGGKILQLSTLGSFLGAVLTSLLLMNYFGVAWTVFINFCLLFALTILLFVDFKKDSIRIILLCSASVLIYGLNVQMENRLFVATNAYSNYQVLQANDKKYLVVNGSPSSMLTTDNKGFSCIEYIKHVLFKELKLRNKAILVLGAGGFSLTAEGTFGNQVTYLDIDERMKKVAEHYFLKNVSGEFVSQDARFFLNHTAKKFDVIIADAYSNRRTIPSHLLTKAFFESVDTALQENGIAVFNVIARPTLEDDYSYAIDHTLRSVFNRCMAVPMEYTDTMNNIIYVCRKEQAAKNKVIYTDDLNRSTLDFFVSSQKK